MQKILTAQEMRDVDYAAVIKLRITEKQLMELAGRVSCDLMTEHFGSMQGKAVAVFCGKGNNGGDGVILTRHLINQGASVDLILLCDEMQMKQDGLATLKILRQYLNATNALRIIEAGDGIPSFVRDKKYDIVVDAILGTGYKKTDNPAGIRRQKTGDDALPSISSETLTKPAPTAAQLATELRPTLSPIVREAVTLINSMDAVCVALDIPTGLDGTTGDTADVCIEAELTVALAFLKTGFFFNAGKKVCGHVRVADISIPQFLTDKSHTNLTDAAFVKLILPQRKPDSSKFDNGKVLIVAGSEAMMGAAILATRSALASGAGYVCVAAPPAAFATLNAAVPEAVLIAQTEAAILEKLKWANAVLIGPGLGRLPATQMLVAKLVTNADFANTKAILDADALNAISELDLLDKLNLTNALLTPHVKEFERLTKISVSQIQAEPLRNAQDFSKARHVSLLLKGNPTVIVTTDGETYLNVTGTKALATAGTGDVLSGLAVSLAAQGLSTGLAGVAAAYLHGLAGQAASEHGNVSASDVAAALKQLRL
jgi:hydroxyethylthiazole kinase-like uncharacterized protein yjeF